MISLLHPHHFSFIDQRVIRNGQTRTQADRHPIPHAMHLRIPAAVSAAISLRPVTGDMP